MKMGCWVMIGFFAFSLSMTMLAVMMYNAIYGLGLSPGDILFFVIWVPIISLIAQFSYILFASWLVDFDVFDPDKKWPAWLADADQDEDSSV